MSKESLIEKYLRYYSISFKKTKTNGIIIKTEYLGEIPLVTLSLGEKCCHEVFGTLKHYNTMRFYRLYSGILRPKKREYEEVKDSYRDTFPLFRSPELPILIKKLEDLVSGIREEYGELDLLLEDIGKKLYRKNLKYTIEDVK